MQLYKNNFDGFSIISNKIKKTTETPDYVFNGEEEVIGGYTTQYLESYEEISIEEAEKLIGKIEVAMLLLSIN